MEHVLPGAEPDANSPAAKGSAASQDAFVEASLWRRYRQDADTDARAKLLSLHMHYARVVAATYYGRRYHDEIEFGDYLQFASVGLLEAMERFDPDRGAQFRTFAARRMHGAILNGLERLTEKQQQIAASQRIRAERTDAVKDLARHRAGVGEGNVPRGPQQLMQYVAEVGLGLALSWLLEGTSMIEDPARAESIPFYRSTELKQLRERLLALVEALPLQERTVIRSHYLQEVPFDQVAASMKLTKGRISQIHKQALLRLRQGAADDGLDVIF